MLDLKYVLGHLDEVRRALERRGGSVDLEPLRRLDEQRKATILEVEQLKARRNEVSRRIGAMIKAGEDASAVREETRRIGETIKALDERQKQLEAELGALLMTLPNLPHESCPLGADESSNREEKVWGRRPEFDFEVRDHVEIGEICGILDFERAAKITGARFAVLSGQAARLERALISFMLDLHTGKHGYRELLPPFIVNRKALEGTGQLPKFEEDLFRLQQPDQWFLAPTAEVPVTNLHAGEILDESDLPRRYAAYTPCFRAEAGSHGRDVRGLIRQHQFDKVELVTFCRPEESYEMLEQLTGHACRVLERLGLHYRLVTLCTGDLGFSAAKTYDLEVWLPSQNTFREISSCSNFEDFQARRAGIRYRPEAGGKPRFVHTLNGSGLAVGRTLLAILENYQNEDGTFRVPEALEPYMHSRIP
ncbi:MAG: serine--tRNA ligase [Acidobacteriota bacterium]|nr:serine--tRNA ligase [Acidobacteriota bacterium]MDQ7088165.1 serine--tRNA ligase [Acidobacteriota bacterium]